MVTPGKVIIQAVMRYFEDCQLPGEGLFRSCCRVVVVGGLSLERYFKKVGSCSERVVGSCRFFLGGKKRETIRRDFQELERKRTRE